jgi:cytochrome P450
MSTPDDQPDEFSTFDITAKDHRKHIEPVWSRMRALSQLPRSDKFGGFCILTKHADVAAASRDAKLFSSAANGIAIPDLSAGGRLLPVESDPPEHTEYRSLFAPFVTNAAMQKHEPLLRSLATGLLHQCAGRPRLDFVKEFARPFPAIAVLSILGIPETDVDRMAHVVDTSVDGAEGEGRGGPQMIAAARELNDYLVRVLQAWQAAPHDPDNIISTIVHSSLPTAPFGLKEKTSLLKIFIFGGFTTTTFALASAMRWLLEHPEDFDRLRRSPELLRSAVDEFVRFSSPGTYVARTAMQDTAIGGTPLRKGDRVLLCYGAANRDAAVFDRPDELMLDRPLTQQTANRHLGFGNGPHGCMGIHLARLEMRVALEECLKVFGDYRVDPHGKIEWASGETEGMSTLPLVLRINPND